MNDVECTNHLNIKNIIAQLRIDLIAVNTTSLRYTINDIFSTFSASSRQVRDM